MKPFIWDGDPTTEPDFDPEKIEELEETDKELQNDDKRD